jgi:hypothetical protein
MQQPDHARKHSERQRLELMLSPPTELMTDLHRVELTNITKRRSVAMRALLSTNHRIL